MGLFCRAAPDGAGGFRQSERAKGARHRIPGLEGTVFHNLISDVSHHHFYFVLLPAQTKPGAAREATTQGCGYQEAGLLSHLGGWRPQLPIAVPRGSTLCTCCLPSFSHFVLWVLCFTPRSQTFFFFFLRAVVKLYPFFPLFLASGQVRVFIQ